MSTSDVVVVGAGPVGLIAAAVLGRKGATVTVLEACETSNPASRASTVHGSTLELMHELDLAWDVIAKGAVVTRMQYRSRKKGFIAEFDFGLIKDHTRFPVRLQTDQREITSIIRSRLESMPNVRIVFNARAHTVTQDGDGVEVAYRCLDTDGCVRARYAIAADGAHSAMRESLGVGFRGMQYESRYLVGFTTYNVLDAMPELAPVTYISDDSEALSVIVLPDHTRLAFHLQRNDSGEVEEAAKKIQKCLERFLPAVDGQYPVTNVLEYSIHRRIADRFRVDRVLLAGDAAHLNSPTGGMGMNSGIHDAYLLGKTLAAVLAGEIGHEALDGYAAARRAVAMAYVQQRAEKNLMAVEEKADTDTHADNGGWAARLRRIADDPVLSREYLLKASMFDSAPRVLW